MFRFSLQRVFAYATLSCVFLGVWSSIWRLIYEENGMNRGAFISFATAIAAFFMALPSIYLCLAIHAAADPLLGVPSALKQYERSPRPLSSAMAIAASISMSSVFAIPTCLVTVIAVVVAERGASGIVRVTFGASMVTYMTLSAIVLGGTLGALPILYMGSRLGRGFLLMFATAAGALGFLYFLPLVVEAPELLSLLGLLGASAGVVSVFTVFRSTQLFGRSARAWSGRASLLCTLMGVFISVAWVTRRSFDDFYTVLAVLLPFVVAIHGGAAGALVGALLDTRRRRNQVASPFTKKKAAGEFLDHAASSPSLGNEELKTEFDGGSA